jgi:hypothetical protein
MKDDFALTVQARADLRRSWNNSYRAADQDLKILQRRGTLPGSIYVFGDPIVLLRANRPQPVPIPGWGPEFLDTRAWRELHSELQSTLPAYINLNDYAASLIRSRYPAMLEFIRTRYRVAFVGASGTWYVLK